MLKKILIIVLAVLFVSVTIFFLLGYLNPSFTYVTRITIDQPREDVWRLFSDETKLDEWLIGFKSIETLSGERNAVGSKYKLRFSQDDKDIEVIEEVKEYRPPETFAFHLDSDFLSDDVRIDFNDLGGKTQVVQTDHVTGAGVFSKSLLFWTRSHLTDAARSNLESLKKFVEGAK